MAYNVWGSYNEWGQAQATSPVTNTIAFETSILERVDNILSFSTTIEENSDVEVSYDFSIPAQKAFIIVGRRSVEI